MPVETKAPPKKKPKNTPIPDEDAPLPEDDDANNFEPTIRTEGNKRQLVEGKKVVEAQRGHVKVITRKKNDGKTVRDELRNQPANLKAAAKKNTTKSSMINS